MSEKSRLIAWMLLAAASLWPPAALSLEPAPSADAATAPAGQEDDGAEARAFIRRMQKEVTRFGFEESSAIEPGKAPLPREWQRHLDDSPSADDPTRRLYGRYPDFLTVGVADLDVPGTPPDAVHGGRRALRMSLAGSRGSDESQGMDLVAVKRRIPLEIDPDSAYELSGWVRMQSTRRPDESWARLGIEWLDEQGRVIASSWSDHVIASRSGPSWTQVPGLRVNDVDGRARFAQVWCKASGHDPLGWVSFDDIELLARPKVDAKPVPDGCSGIFAPDEIPALKISFTGLRPQPAPQPGAVPAALGRVLGLAAGAGYVRSVAVVDLFGRRISVADRQFAMREVQDGALQEDLRLDALARPGTYAVEITLSSIGPRGERTEITRRVLRLVKLAAAPAPASSPGAAAVEPAGIGGFGVEAGLHGTDARQLLEAVGRLNIPTVAVNLWGAAKPAAGPQVPSEVALARLLRGPLGRKVLFEGVLLSGREAVAAYSSADPRAKLQPEAIAEFRSDMMAWRLASADGNLAAAGGREWRAKLAAEIRSGALEKAAHKTVNVPVALDGLEPGADGDERYRETVFVPASLSPAQLEKRLAALFPRPAPAGGAAAARAGAFDWHLELPAASENLGLGMKEERDQVTELARKATLLVAAGAGRCFVSLSDSKQGLMGPGLNPRPAAAAWRTLGQHLSGAEFLGDFDLCKDADVRAWAFRRGDEGLVVFWADGPEREIPVQLGTRGRARLVEITGYARELRPARTAAESAGLAEAEMVPLAVVPAILTGMDPAFIRTRQSFQLAAGSKVQCRYEPQPVVFELQNHFRQDLSARIFPRFPQGSAVTPRFQKVDVRPGETAKVTFSVRPSFVETTGDKEAVADLYLMVKDGRETFTITRTLRYESMLSMECVPPVPDESGRTARVQIAAGVKEGIEPRRNLTDLEIYLSVPGVGRQRVLLEDVPTGKSLLAEPFTVVLGAREQKAYASVRERNGSWFANLEIKLPAAVPPRYADRR
ncbi:MAG TPA: hypothetical protein PK280_05195 [Planctomycetota bacterium]|nr:hypothetical protein [Planctomycetota bacterium]